MNWRPAAVLLLAAALLSACAGPVPRPSAELAAAAPAAVTPADRFLASLRPYCGQAFAGRIVADQPGLGEAAAPAPAGPDPFAGQTLVMHVRECGDDRLAIPFHVGDDRSRTWLLTRTARGLQLKHDHRHRDGSPDASILYGGDSIGPGTAARQRFPVDAESIGLFEAEGRSASTHNVWALEIGPGQRFVYELSRPSGRLFRVEFDLATAVAPPPAPWGQE